MIFALYGLLSIVLTYPLILHVTTQMQGAGDGFYFMWELWWFSHSLMTGRQPVHNNTIFYPAHDVRMVWWTTANEIPAVALEPLLGPVATYNLLTLFNIAVSGYTAYFLVRRMTGNPRAAFLSGCIYAYAPFHFINAFKGLLNMTTWQYLPLCALAGFMLMERPGLRMSLFFGLSLALVALSDGYICAYFLILFVPAYIVLSLRGKGKSPVPWIGVSFVVSCALVAPFLQSFVALAGASSHAETAAFDVGIYSQRLLRYVIPYRFHPLWGRYFAWFYPDPYIEASCFTGYIPLALGAIALIQKRKPGMKVFWGAIGLSALILSLGPYLHVWNIVTIGGYPFPLPYLALSKLPFLFLLRLPVRFSIIFILSLSVLSGLALARTRNVLIYGFLIVGLSLEYILFIPYPLSEARIPAVYRWVKSDPTIGAVLELPSGQADPEYISSMNRYMYYQTYHHKPMVSGHLPRVPDGLEEYTRQTPLLREITHPKVLLHGDIVPLNEKRSAPEGLRSLAQNSIDLIILHKDAREALSAGEFNAIERLLTRVIGRPEYEDGETVSYRVPKNPGSVSPPGPMAIPYYSLSQGWYEPYYIRGIPHRFTQGHAEISIEARSGDYKLQFGIMRPQTHTRTLEVLSDDRVVETMDVSSLPVGKETRYVTQPFHIPGTVRIGFRVKEGAARPIGMMNPLMAVEHPMALPVGLDIFGVRLEPQ